MTLAVDAESADGRKVRQKLLQSADVMIEKIAPGSMARCGLSFGNAASASELLPGTSVTSGADQVAARQKRPEGLDF